MHGCRDLVRNISLLTSLIGGYPPTDLRARDTGACQCSGCNTRCMGIVIQSDIIVAPYRAVIPISIYFGSTTKKMLMNSKQSDGPFAGTWLPLPINTCNTRDVTAMLLTLAEWPV